jgi:hypothetical protein
MKPELFQKIMEEIVTLSNEELWELIAEIRTLLKRRGEII